MSLKVRIWHNHLYSSTQPKPTLTSYLFISLVVIRNSSPGFLKDITKLFFGCWLLFVPFSVKMIPHCFNYLEVRALGRIHPSIRPVATDFQSSY